MNFEQVFTFNNLYKSSKKSCNKVRWKTSTKNFEINIVENVAILRKQIVEGTFKSKGFFEFILNDRGKTRNIKAVHITERAIQKCFCDYWLIPLLRPRLIYDSGATITDKGMDFALNRLKCHLQRFGRKYGNDGYILMFDIHDYFNSINNSRLLNKVQRLSDDERLFSLYKYFINCFGERGLGLGSQVSQISALFYLNELDHYIKEKLHCKFYGRYMDDAYIISNKKEDLYAYLEDIEVQIENEDLQLNRSKVKICKVSSFIFLKRHWKLKENNFVEATPIHATLKRFKKKWKVLKNKDKEVQRQFKASVHGTLKFFKQRRLEKYVYA